MQCAADVAGQLSSMLDSSSWREGAQLPFWGFKVKQMNYEIINYPKSRLATVDAGRFGHNKHYMFGLFEVDVTGARHHLENSDGRVRRSLSQSHCRCL
jgi:hypothetical protein